MTSASGYWDTVGSDWDLIGPPLRPCPEDCAIMEGMVARWDRAARVAAPQAVILGVTQELVRMQWPENTHILAIDKAEAMIQSLWPHHRLSNAAAIWSNWFTLPLVNGSADLVVGDAPLTSLIFPDEYRQVAKELARILSPGGVVFMRVSVVPPDRESVEDVFRDLWAGAIGNFNTFKWRLAMALTDPLDGNVVVNDIWEAWHIHMESAERLAETLGWPLPVIRMIERYRGSVSTRYSFPSLEQVQDTFSPHFRMEETFFPSYQDSGRYPTVCFRKA
jgi:hypothetical protein